MSDNTHTPINALGFAETPDREEFLKIRDLVLNYAREGVAA